MAQHAPTRASAPKKIDRHWHLATDKLEVGLTEFELSVFRVAAAFERWQSDCSGCCYGQTFSGTDTAVLHVVRMHDRPKSISEIGRLLKRDDISNLQYGVRKLLKAGLVEKTEGGGSKRDVTYRVTHAGRDMTEQYAAFRRELLISMVKSAAPEADFDATSRLLNMMSALYDQASCVAATHRVAP
jgi:predicted MarR family transcription regulator